MPKAKATATKWLSASEVTQAAKDGATVAKAYGTFKAALNAVFEPAMKGFKERTTDSGELKKTRAEYTAAMKASKAFEDMFDGDASFRSQVCKAWTRAEAREVDTSTKPKFDATKNVLSTFNRLSWPEWEAFVVAVNAKVEETK